MPLMCVSKKRILIPLSITLLVFQYSFTDRLAGKMKRSLKNTITPQTSRYSTLWKNILKSFKISASSSRCDKIVNCCYVRRPWSSGQWNVLLLQNLLQSANHTSAILSEFLITGVSPYARRWTLNARFLHSFRQI